MNANVLNTHTGNRLLNLVDIKPENFKKYRKLLTQAGFKTWEANGRLWTEAKGYTLQDAAYYISLVLANHYGSAPAFKVEIVGN